MMKKMEGTYKGIKWEFAKILSIFKWASAVTGEHYTVHGMNTPQPEVPRIGWWV